MIKQYTTTFPHVTFAKETQQGWTFKSFNWPKQFLIETDSFWSRKNLLRLPVSINVSLSVASDGIIQKGASSCNCFVRTHWTRLQPFNVTVYSSYKSSVLNEFAGVDLIKSVLNCCGDGSNFSRCYSESFKTRNIQHEVCNTAIWNPVKQPATIKVLENLPYFNPNSDHLPTDQEVMEVYKQYKRGHFREAETDKYGTVVVNAISSAHITSDCVFAALEERSQRRVAESSLARILLKQREPRTKYPESASKIAHHMNLAPNRMKKFFLLCQTRRDRRQDAFTRTIAKALILCFDGSTPSVWVGIVSDEFECLSECGLFWFDLQATIPIKVIGSTFSRHLV